MRVLVSLPVGLVGRVEARARRSGTGVGRLGPRDTQFAQLISLGLLKLLADGLRPLFPCYEQSRPELSPRPAPAHAVRRAQPSPAASLPCADVGGQVGGGGQG